MSVGLSANIFNVEKQNQSINQSLFLSFLLSLVLPLTLLFAVVLSLPAPLFFPLSPPFTSFVLIFVNALYKSPLLLFLLLDENSPLAV